MNDPRTQLKDLIHVEKGIIPARNDAASNVMISSSRKYDAGAGNERQRDLQILNGQNGYRVTGSNAELQRNARTFQ